MKKQLLTLLFSLLLTTFYAQDLILTGEFPGTSTWPFLWDIAQDDQGNLYTCSEQGVLFVKSNGVWSTHDLNPNSFEDARDIAIDGNGVVWIGAYDGLYSFDAGVITHFTTANSDLPDDEINKLAAYQDQVWIGFVDQGLALKVGDNFTHYTTSNSDLPASYSTKIEVKADGTVVHAAGRDVTFIKNNVWTVYDFDELFTFGSSISDFTMDHNQDIWFATRYGIIRHDHSSNQMVDMSGTYPADYLNVIYTPNDELWLSEKFKGLHYRKGSTSYFFDESTTDAPSQVFDFAYYQDSVRLIGNIGSRVATISIGFLDNDGDGFASNVDCDDTNPDVNPNAIEIIYNGLDDDCDPATLDDDLDEDGFAMDVDCDDENPDISPGQPEIPFNNIDDDCDPLTLDNDGDQDGFLLPEDCDDTNPDINPGATEIPYNGLDDDCNAQTFDDDLDQDGFANAEDCDDDNPSVNPNATEIVYNGLDDDCDPATLDDDLDEDGFAFADDCDDDNPNINPDAIEIPDNGIDEDCLDGDLSSVINFDEGSIEFYPNPVQDYLNIVVDGIANFEVEVIDVSGRLLLKNTNPQQLDFSTFEKGIYFLKFRMEEQVSTTAIVVN